MHKLAGLAGLPLLIVLAVTGVMLALPDETDAVLTPLRSPVDALPSPRSARAGRNGPRQRRDRHCAGALAGCAAGLDRGAGRGHGAFRLRLQQPGDPSRRFPHGFVWIDRFSGRVLAVPMRHMRAQSTTVNNWLHPLHDGSAGGIATRALTALAGWCRWCCSSPA